MRIQTEGASFTSASPSAVTIGNFDGLHRGHLRLLRALRTAATNAGLTTAVVTFEPHTLWRLRPVAAPKLLLDTRQKLRELHDCGLVDICLVLPFDEARGRQHPTEFVREVLVERLRARHLTVGAGFRFGGGQAGDTTSLRDLGIRHGFVVDETPLVRAYSTPTSQPCSSTLVRRLVADGRLDRANLLLHRPHTVTGRVVATSWPTRGRGTPTAVIRIPHDRALPLEGSYAGAVITTDGRERMAGISVRPGMNVGSEAMLDAHLTDRVEALMDRPVAVRFHRRIWSSGPSDLFAQVDEHNSMMAVAEATGGWGSAA